VTRPTIALFLPVFIVVCLAEWRIGPALPSVTNESESIPVIATPTVTEFEPSPKIASSPESVGEIFGGKPISC
jgi:hypothetical protein